MCVRFTVQTHAGHNAVMVALESAIFCEQSLWLLCCAAHANMVVFNELSLACRVHSEPARAQKLRRKTMARP